MGGKARAKTSGLAAKMSAPQIAHEQMAGGEPLTHARSLSSQPYAGVVWFGMRVVELFNCEGERARR